MGARQRGANAQRRAAPEPRLRSRPGRRRGPERWNCKNHWTKWERFSSCDMDVNELIAMTEDCFRELNIPMRDTWKGLAGENLDDTRLNGATGGKRHVRIEAANVPFCQIKAKIDDLPGYTSVAYSDYVVQVPDRMKDREDALIHEFAHFLQANTRADEANYIMCKPDMTNMPAYYGQRTEREAHLIQLYYLAKHAPDRVKKFGLVPSDLEKAVREAAAGSAAKQRDLIMRMKINHKVI